jgi:phenylalanyl-tRNA synthetase beta chain
VLERLGLAGDARTLINPMSDELDTMRTSLLPSLLAVARYNQDRNGEQVDAFEMARVYLGKLDGGLAEEPMRLMVMARVGEGADAGREGFLRLKSVMDRVAAEVAAATPAYERDSPPLFHPGRTARIKLAGKELGIVGELHPTTLAAFDLDGRIVALDVDVAALLKGIKERKAVELPRYPAIRQDLAPIVDDTAAAADLEATIKSAGKPYLASVRAFDEYRGGQVGEGRKSVAFTLTFRSPERTLTDAEVEGVMAEIKRALEKQHQAGFRK